MNKQPTTMTKQELALMLGFSTKTLYRRLKAANILYDGTLLTLPQTKEIMKKLGYRWSKREGYFMS